MVDERLDGMIQWPIVATAQAAREIYLAVARNRGDKIKPGNEILVTDDGSHWEVFQYPAHLPTDRVEGGNEIVHVVVGDRTGCTITVWLSDQISRLPAEAVSKWR